MVSEICASFGCTPAEALQQDPMLVRRVFQYRDAKWAKALFNAKDKGASFETLRDNPQLLRVLSYMHRAQSGLPLWDPHGDAEREGMSIASEYQAKIPDEDPS